MAWERDKKKKIGETIRKEWSGGQAKPYKVGLAAGRGEGGDDVVLLAGGVGQGEDEHVLGKPSLVAGEVGGDAEGKALLSEERVATVARTERPDLAGLGEVDNLAVGDIAGPDDVLLSGLERLADRVDAGDKLTVAKGVEDLGAWLGTDVK